MTRSRGSRRSAALGLAARVGALAIAAAAFPGLAAPTVEFRSVGSAPAILYDAPSAAATKLFVASPAYPLEVVVQLGKTWTKVRDVAGEFAWVETRQLVEKRTVVVTVAQAEVRERPEDRAAVLFRVEKDVVLDLAEPPTTTWIKVRHRDGQVGYVRLSQIWGI